jgi:hypothetical protein
MAFDIIGDIHGHADRLERLLERLDYRKGGDGWAHPDRKAIFVGDLIDRGPGQLRTLSLVRDMVVAGAAEVAMGNHELNAIGWATRDPDQPHVHLRPRHGARGEKNRLQHEAFLNEVGADSPAHEDWVAWFKTLPLWIEKPGLRVVHACWSPAAVAAIRPRLTADFRLTDEILQAAYRPTGEVGRAVDTLLKGPEVRLPEGVSFTDKDGHVRHEIRIRWWRPDLSSFRDAYIGPDDVDIPDSPLPAAATIPEPDRPTFIGHYWLSPARPPEPLSRRVACVDYSVAKGGPLAAYRFDGEVELSAKKFLAV